MSEIIIMIASLSSLFIAGTSAAFFVVIKFNDLKHQEVALTRIEAAVKEIDKKLDINSERVAKIEGKCLANHG